MSASKYKNLKSLVPMTKRLQAQQDDWQDIFDKFLEILPTLGTEKYYWSKSLKSDPVRTVLWPFARALAIHPGVDLTKVWTYRTDIDLLCNSNVPLLDGLSLHPMIPIWMDDGGTIYRLAFYTSAILALEKNSDSGNGFSAIDYMGIDPVDAVMFTMVTSNLMAAAMSTLEDRLRRINVEDILRVASRADEIAIERDLGENDRTHHLYRQLFTDSRSASLAKP